MVQTQNHRNDLRSRTRKITAFSAMLVYGLKFKQFQAILLTRPIKHIPGFE